mmetsp:Transcript_29034/g.92899  ORF Transcript_29034/g.92899 Transcript_29034/m.92899 type:complete len:265 (+) Transcript_29034:3677-4471(+)
MVSVSGLRRWSPPEKERRARRQGRGGGQKQRGSPTHRPSMRIMYNMPKKKGSRSKRDQEREGGNAKASASQAAEAEQHARRDVLEVLAATLALALPALSLGRRGRRGRSALHRGARNLSSLGSGRHHLGGGGGGVLGASGVPRLWLGPALALGLRCGRACLLLSSGRLSLGGLCLLLLACLLRLVLGFVLDLVLVLSAALALGRLGFGTALGTLGLLALPLGLALRLGLGGAAAAALAAGFVALLEVHRLVACGIAAAVLPLLL